MPSFDEPDRDDTIDAFLSDVGSQESDASCAPSFVSFDYEESQIPDTSDCEYEGSQIPDNLDYEGSQIPEGRYQSQDPEYDADDDSSSVTACASDAGEYGSETEESVKSEDYVSMDDVREDPEDYASDPGTPTGPQTPYHSDDTIDVDEPESPEDCEPMDDVLPESEDSTRQNEADPRGSHSHSDSPASGIEEVEIPETDETDSISGETQQAYDDDPDADIPNSEDGKLFARLEPLQVGSKTVAPIKLPRNSPLKRVKVGRHPTKNDVVLKSLQISKFHCVFAWNGECDDASVVTLENLSNSCCWVSRADVHVKLGPRQYCELKDGDIIGIGRRTSLDLVNAPPAAFDNDHRYIYHHTAHYMEHVPTDEPKTSRRPRSI